MIQEKLTKFPGVHRRADSGIYQFGLRSPVDLAAHFPSGWAVRCSLKTADLRVANEKAKELQANWAKRFDAMRSGRPQPVDIVALRRKLFAMWQGALARLDSTYSVLPKAQRDERAEMSAWQVADLRNHLRDGCLPLWAEDQAKRYGDPTNPSIVTEFGAHLLMLHEVMHEAASDERRTFPLRVRYQREREQAMEAIEQGVAAPIALVRTAPVDGKKIAHAIKAWVFSMMRYGPSSPCHLTARQAERPLTGYL